MVKTGQSMFTRLLKVFVSGLPPCYSSTENTSAHHKVLPMHLKKSIGSIECDTQKMNEFDKIHYKDTLVSFHEELWLPLFKNLMYSYGINSVIK